MKPKQGSVSIALHPAVFMMFFAIAVVFTMAFLNPWFLLTSLACASLLYILLRGSEGLRPLIGLLAMAVAIALLNPLFNTSGSFVLFTYFGSRPYTAESLAYGCAIGAMVMSIMLWFLCFNEVVSSAGVAGTLGRFAPSASMLVIMTMRMIPLQMRRIREVRMAQRCAGMPADSGSMRERARNAASVMKGSFDPLFENALQTAESMRSRGYGSGRRTSFAMSCFGVRDAIAITLIAAATIGVLACAFMGATAWSYTPAISFTHAGAPFVLGICLYAALLAWPSVFLAADMISVKSAVSRMGR